MKHSQIKFFFYQIMEIFFSSKIMLNIINFKYFPYPLISLSLNPQYFLFNFLARDGKTIDL